jgi:hypothetical protein
MDLRIGATMLSTIELLAWLSAANRRYGAEGIPHKGRPFRAMSDFTREHNCSLALDDPVTKMVFEWFYERSPPGAHQMGAVYTGIYLYDTAFWPVHVPIIFGMVSLNALDCLETMPSQIKLALESDHRDIWSYVVHWVNCMDYGYGHMDLEGGSRLRPRAQKFLGAGHYELVGANAQLLEPRPNVKAILGMRMATEIFLKATLIQERDLTERQLMNLGHTLADSANACAEATKLTVFEEIAKSVSLYPPVSARYDDTKCSSTGVWRAAALTQLTAATFTRLYTSRDMRASIMPTKLSNT